MTDLEKLQLRVERAKREIKDRLRPLIEELRYCCSSGSGMSFDFAEMMLKDILNDLESD